MPESPARTVKPALQSADVQAELRHYAGIGWWVAGLGVLALAAFLAAASAGSDGALGMVLIVLLVGGAVAAVMGIGMLLRIHRQRAVLGVNPFVSFALTIETGPAGRRLVIRDAAGEEHEVLMCPVVRGRADRAGIMSASDLELAGTPKGYAVARVPRTGALLSVIPKK